MSIFGTGGGSIEGELKNPNELLEAFIYDELSQLTDEDKEVFVNSEEARVMEEAGIIGRRTLVRLSKNDDLARRTKMASFQIAKENNDPLWDQLVKNRVKERMLINKIVSKYGSRATRAAKLGQKDYIKRMPKGFMRMPTVR